MAVTIDVSGQGTAYNADPKSVVAAIMIALGVMPGSDESVFDNLVLNCTVDVVGDGTTTLFVVEDGGISYSLVLANLVDLVREWLYKNGVVTESGVDEGYAFYNGIRLPVLPWEVTYGVINYISSGDYYVWNYSSDVQPFLRDLLPDDDVIDYTLYFDSGGRWGQYTCTLDSTAWSRAGVGNTPVGYDGNNVIWANFDLYYEDGTLYIAGSDPLSYGIFVSDGLSMGEIVSYDTALLTGYPSWMSTTYTMDGFTLYRLAVLENYESTRNSDQNSIWGGAIDFVPGEPNIFDDIEAAEPVIPDYVDDGTTDNGFLYYIYQAITETIPHWISSLGIVLYDRIGEVLQSISDFSTAVSANFSNLMMFLADEFQNLAGIFRMDEVVDNLEDVNEDLDDVNENLTEVITGGEAGSDLTDSSGEISTGAASIDEFEQEQMDVLDNSMEEMEESVSYDDFIPALSFIQKYVEMAFDSMGNLSVVLFMPMYLGVFFFICSRVPGNTRSRRSKPNTSAKKQG